MAAKNFARRRKVVLKTSVKTIRVRKWKIGKANSLIIKINDAKFLIMFWFGCKTECFQKALSCEFLEKLE